MTNVNDAILKVFSGLNLDRLVINDRPRVLFYHGVAQNIVSPKIELESIEAGEFERQLKYIKRYFRPITIDEFYAKFIGNNWEGGEILITFDDGYKNILTTGLPLLERYDIPFALFITTDNLSKGSLFPTTINRLVNQASTYSKKLGKAKDIVATTISHDLKTLPIECVENICAELLSNLSPSEIEDLKHKYSSVIPMNWDDARVVASSPLCTIGSHCVTHICCHDQQNILEVKRQFELSRSIIREKLGVACDYLSYPNGNYTPETMQMATACGYKMAFSTRYEPIDTSTANKMAVGRIYVPYDYYRFKYAVSTYPR